MFRAEITVPLGLCGCGCGKPTPIAKQTRISLGHVRGVPTRFTAGHRYPPPPIADRFWARVRKSDGCWEWTGNRIGHPGMVLYGAFLNDSGTKVLAHRFSWMLHFGPIPAGLYVCHHCDNPPCVRPDHLFVGTDADNVHDAMAKGRHVKPPNRWALREQP